MFSSVKRSSSWPWSWASGRCLTTTAGCVRYWIYSIGMESYRATGSFTLHLPDIVRQGFTPTHLPLERKPRAASGNSIIMSDECVRVCWRSRVILCLQQSIQSCAKRLSHFSFIFAQKTHVQRAPTHIPRVRANPNEQRGTDYREKWKVEPSLTRSTTPVSKKQKCLLEKVTSRFTPASLVCRQTLNNVLHCEQ